jgi:hypothetical protein
MASSVRAAVRSSFQAVPYKKSGIAEKWALCIDLSYIRRFAEAGDGKCLGDCAN